MKQTLLLFLFTFTLKVISQTTAIPDKNFEQILVNRGIDTNGLNGNILNSDAAGLSYLGLFSCNISNLQGIEAFVDLTGLQVAANNLTSLDVSQNVNLRSLRFNHNNISTLNITGLTNLEIIDGRQTLLTSLDLSDFPNLKEVIFENNIFTQFDMRNGSNNIITNFWLTGCPNLTCIYVDDANASYLSSWNKDATSTFVNNEAACEALGFDDHTVHQIKVFPNPVVDIVNIESEVNIQKVEIIDALGRVIKIIDQNTINISDFQKGIYYMRIAFESGVTYTNQIVKL